MKLARARGIYSRPEAWERIGRRARRLRMPISRLVVRCCLRAAGGDGPMEVPGHPLALGEDAQRRLLEDVRAAVRPARIAVRAPGGGEAELHGRGRPVLDVVRGVVAGADSRGRVARQRVDRRSHGFRPTACHRGA